MKFNWPFKHLLFRIRALEDASNELDEDVIPRLGHAEDRIAQLEHQVRELRRELDRMKNERSVP